MILYKHGGDNIKNIGFPIPDDLYLQLKIICLKENKSLKDYMVKLVEKAVLEYQNDKKE